MFVAEKVRFPEEEDRILDYWGRIRAFERANELSQGRPVFSFYDGPPFATGLPHYGHLLAGTIKDVVTRYAYANGFHVPRRFGWDCHGLPIEFEIEKKLGIKTKDDVLSMGIAKYNEECRAIVMRFSSQWEATVTRMGRWIDFRNDYKTLDLSFMESVWWVFKQLYDRNLVYSGFRVMPYSTACTTPLSNFEANLNYKEVTDPAVTVSFPILGRENEHFLAWTTTPWTLPSNVALCVNPQMDYVKLLDLRSGLVYYMAEARICHLYKPPKKGSATEAAGYQIQLKLKGTEFVGWQYTPLFDYYAEELGKTAFRVVADDYVTSEAGTGIVHQAPAFGEDDYRVCLANGIVKKDDKLPCPVDESGRFTHPVRDLLGKGVKDADKDIITLLKQSKRLVKNDTILHSYPFCWRSETPLIYKAVPSWFVRVESFKDRLVENNKLSHWVPQEVQFNRFGNWLEGARDWNVSRNRYWGTPIPIWMNARTGETLVVGSVAELERLSGEKGISDIHRHHIDHIKIISPITGDELDRIEEVFDCWFESGSMPYAQIHYPFEPDSEKTFSNSFPADFIAEGLDQTRGWFYTLLALSTALFDKPAFKNCVVNGLVLASDGKKMSKRLKNYPDPLDVVNNHGADALRLYLINSPVVRAEEVRFSEDGVRSVVRDVMLPWFNAYRFLFQNARQLDQGTSKPLILVSGRIRSTNEMDLWIESCMGSLIAFVKKEMDCYRLYTVVPRLLSFIDSLTNWYVRLNRPRLKGQEGPEEMRMALETLAETLITLGQLMAPFTPFFSELTYQSLRLFLPEGSRQESVHFLMLPESKDDTVDLKFEAAVERMQEVILNGRVARDRRNVALKQPLRSITVVHRDPDVLASIKRLERYIMSELNVLEVVYSSDESAYVNLRADADGKVLGKKLGRSFKAVHSAVRSLTPSEVLQFEREQVLTLTVSGQPSGSESHTLSLSDVKIIRELKDGVGGENCEAVGSGGTSGMLILLDLTLDEGLVTRGRCREIVNRTQKLRKKAGLEPEDLIEVYYDCSEPFLVEIFETHGTVICEALKTSPPRPMQEKPELAETIVDEEVDQVEGAFLRLCLARR